jgi:hypothetical protein
MAHCESSMRQHLREQYPHLADSEVAASAVYVTAI